MLARQYQRPGHDPSRKPEPCRTRHGSNELCWTRVGPDVPNGPPGPFATSSLNDVFDGENMSFRVISHKLKRMVNSHIMEVDIIFLFMHTFTLNSLYIVCRPTIKFTSSIWMRCAILHGKLPSISSTNDFDRDIILSVGAKVSTTTNWKKMMQNFWFFSLCFM